jgi:hypothetical protein
MLKKLIKIMESCWDQNPSNRPTFNEVCSKIEAIISTHLNTLPSGTLFHDVLVLPGANNNNNDTKSGKTETTLARNEDIKAAVQSFNINVKDILIGPKIGKGSYAVVYEGKYAGTHVAIKEILFEGSTKDVIDEFNKECKLMLNFRHPNIVLFMGNAVTETKLYMITELLIRGKMKFCSFHQVSMIRIMFYSYACSLY